MSTFSQHVLERLGELSTVPPMSTPLHMNRRDLHESAERFRKIGAPGVMLFKKSKSAGINVNVNAPAVNRQEEKEDDSALLKRMDWPSGGPRKSLSPPTEDKSHDWKIFDSPERARTSSEGNDVVRGPPDNSEVDEPAPTKLDEAGEIPLGVAPPASEELIGGRKPPIYFLVRRHCDSDGDGGTRDGKVPCSDEIGFYRIISNEAAMEMDDGR